MTCSFFVDIAGHVTHNNRNLSNNKLILGYENLLPFRPEMMLYYRGLKETIQMLLRAGWLTPLAEWALVTKCF